MNKSKLSFVLLVCLFITILLNTFYINYFGNYETIENQEDMILDVYYYWQQGLISKVNIPFTFNIFEYTNYSPTKNSTGVVFLSMLLSQLSENIMLVPWIIFLIYLILIWFVRPFKTDCLSLLILFLSLCPLTMLVSKEGILYIGAILVLISRYQNKNLISRINFAAGISLIVLARPEVGLVLIASFFLSIVKINKYLFIFITVFIICYFIDELLIKSIDHEEYMRFRDTLVFSGEFKYILITSDSHPFVILLTRLLTSVLLPLKWLGSIFLVNTDNIFYVINTLLQFLFVIFSAIQIYKLNSIFKFSRLYNESMNFKILVNFTIIYVGYYMVFIYHQPSRQIIYALTNFIFLSSIIMNNEKNQS
jgi:hypothetical protein